MDIIHHTLIGGVGFNIASDLNQPLVGVAFLIGSIFPDLDVIFMFFGKRFYLRNHQGITHSLILAPLFSILLCLALLWLLKLEWNWPIYFAVLVGLLIHIVLDWFNTFRIALFYPLIKTRFSLDAVFFIDSVLLTLTASFYLLYVYMDIKVITYIYPALFTIYCIIKIHMHRTIITELKPLYAIPSSINPFEFFILEQKNNVLSGYLYNTISKNKGSNKTYNLVSKENYVLAETSSVYRELKIITRALTITNISNTDDGITITASDLAVRNFGGKFAKTILKFDHQGNLIDEMANI